MHDVHYVELYLKKENSNKSNIKESIFFESIANVFTIFFTYSAALFRVYI